jgi:hypothetical protein
VRPIPGTHFNGERQRQETWSNIPSTYGIVSIAAWPKIKANIEAGKEVSTRGLLDQITFRGTANSRPLWRASYVSSR